MEHAFRKRDVLLPISEPVLQLNSPALSNIDTRKLSADSIHFQQNLREVRLSRQFRCRRGMSLGLRRRLLYTFWQTTKNGVTSGNSTLDCQIHAAAQPGEIRFPRQQGEWCAPVRTFLDRGLCHCMVIGNVKPHGLAVRDEKLFFRRL